jgi:DNA-binding MarR family transcriptional regulator
MQNQVLDFADRLNETMPVIMREFARRLGNELYKDKITLPQILILDLLDKHGESRMSDMAHVMKVTTAATTGIVDRLVKCGYVMRVFSPDDRRIIKIKLTPKGLALIRKISLERRQMVVRTFGRLSEQDRQDYLRILLQIKNILTQETPT